MVIGTDGTGTVVGASGTDGTGVPAGEVYTGVVDATGVIDSTGTEEATSVGTDTTGVVVNGTAGGVNGLFRC